MIQRKFHLLLKLVLRRTNLENPGETAHGENEDARIEHLVG